MIRVRPSLLILGAAIMTAMLTASTARADRASEIFDATGIRGGLVVHLGCGDGQLTAGLRNSERFVVHGLDADPANVAAARATVEKLGLYGPVSIELLEGASLPYADNLVRMIVVDGSAVDVADDEIMRVLCPGGMAYVMEDGKATIMRKPWPASIDQWTHFLHDASNDCVARDEEIGPPRRLIWHCGPEWARSHEYTSSLVAMISGGGRLFYIFDEGETGVTSSSLPERWRITARDAFSGVLLWNRQVDDFRGGLWMNRSLRGVSPSVQRIMVAEDDRLLMPLGLAALVSILDAATGDVIAVCEGSEAPAELRVSGGVLLTCHGNRAKQAIRAYDATDGTPLWQSKEVPVHTTMAADGERVYYVTGGDVVCVDLKTGEPIWRQEGIVKASRSAPPLVVYRDTVLVAAGGPVRALDAATGQTRWSADMSAGGRGEMFIAQDRVWLPQGKKFVGLDLATGEPVATVDPAEINTPGHHPRCYQSKATENYIITPERGIEFVDLTGDACHAQSDWIRGACTYGIMPANGLLYVPPDPCFCYPGVRVTGFNAMAGADEASASIDVDCPADERLMKGPAFEDAADLAAKEGDSGDWPTYRHDGRRSGASTTPVAAAPIIAWEANLGGQLTPPVMADGRVYVARKDSQILYALNATDGKVLWRYTTGGRVDSPPTILGGLVVFGSADGWIYCLRAEDGVLAWKFRAAPVERRIVSYERLESPWPVHGSVLVHDGVAYLTAGRSTYMDGGIHLYAVDPATGRTLNYKKLDTYSRLRDDAVGKPFVAGYHMEGALADLLVCENDFIYMAQYKFDTSLAEQPCPYILAGDPSQDRPKPMDLTGQPFVDPQVQKTEPLEVHQRQWLENAAKDLVAQLRQDHGSFNIGHRRMGRHVLANFGLLDDSWFNRSYWMYSDSWPGFYLANYAAKSGQILVVGPERTYAVQGYTTRNMQSPLFTPGETGYLLVADANDNEPLLDQRTRETTKGWGFTRAAPPAWHLWTSILVRGITLAGDRLFVVGAPDVVDPEDPMAAMEGRAGSVLQVVDAKTGTLISTATLDAAPIFDGLIGAGGSLFMSTTDGRVICLK